MSDNTTTNRETLTTVFLEQLNDLSVRHHCLVEANMILTNVVEEINDDLAFTTETARAADIRLGEYIDEHTDRLDRLEAAIKALIVGSPVDALVALRDGTKADINAPAADPI